MIRVAARAKVNDASVRTRRSVIWSPLPYFCSLHTVLSVSRTRPSRSFTSSHSFSRPTLVPRPPLARPSSKPPPPMRASLALASLATVATFTAAQSTSIPLGYGRFPCSVVQEDGTLGPGASSAFFLSSTRPLLRCAKTDPTQRVFSLPSWQTPPSAPTTRSTLRGSTRATRRAPRATESSRRGRSASSRSRRARITAAWRVQSAPRAPTATMGTVSRGLGEWCSLFSRGGTS